jgi:hypothetical protein
MSDIIDPAKWGVSFSTKQCRALQISPAETLQWLLHEVGFRRFRLMSYWNEHEKTSGAYDFSALDMQIEHIAQAGGQVTLCLGARQPRWPENHWPNWAWELDKDKRTEALLKFIKTVVNRYKQQAVIISWQLENEALLKQFGRRPEVDRKRLKQEYKLIKNLDTSRPVIMSTSNGWGIPLRSPIPDIVGFSYYSVMYQKGAYRKTIHRPWLYEIRKWLIHYWWNKPSFIHELQCEPWGPDAIWKMSIQEQNNSIDPAQITNNIQDAQRIQAYPVDLWGAEWWYWRLHKHHDIAPWHAVRIAIAPSNSSAETAHSVQ